MCIRDRKACFVLDAIRGKDVTTALAILEYNPRYASSLIKKLLESAVANAEKNNGMNKDNLDVAECYAKKGPTMKRVHPRAQGRAYRIEKRMSQDVYKRQGQPSARERKGRRRRGSRSGEFFLGHSRICGAQMCIRDRSY